MPFLPILVLLIVLLVVVLLVVVGDAEAHMQELMESGEWLYQSLGHWDLAPKTQALGEWVARQW